MYMYNILLKSKQRVKPLGTGLNLAQSFTELPVNVHVLPQVVCPSLPT